MVSQEVIDWASGEITEITYPSPKVKDYAFCSCTKLEKIDCIASKGFTEIGAESFRMTDSLQEVNLENVRTVRDYAFDGCGLEEILLPSIVSISNSHVFSNCTNLTKLLIGKDCAEDLNSANSISGCNALTEIWLLSESKVITIHQSALEACDHYKTNGDRTGRIYVPQSMVESYKNTTAFANYKDLIVGIS